MLLMPHTSSIQMVKSNSHKILILQKFNVDDRKIFPVMVCLHVLGALYWRQYTVELIEFFVLKLIMADQPTMCSIIKSVRSTIISLIIVPTSSSSTDHIVLVRASVDSIKIENKVNTQPLPPKMGLWDLGRYGFKNKSSTNENLLNIYGQRKLHF